MNASRFGHVALTGVFIAVALLLGMGGLDSVAGVNVGNWLEFQGDTGNGISKPIVDGVDTSRFTN